MSGLDEVANQFRRDVLARDEQALRAVQGAYAVAKISINGALNSVTDAITERRASGQPVSRAWLLRQQSLTALLQTVEIEMAGLGAYAAAQTTANQAIVTSMGVEHARQLATEAIGDGPPGVTLPWAQLPAGALENLIGVLEDGTALSEHLSQHGPAAAGEVRDALVSGITLGEGIRPLAKRVGAALDQRADDVLTLTRTETLRAYREASLASYRANLDVVIGWTWHSARGFRTCAFCWSQHGRTFNLDTEFASHPRCIPAGAIVAGPRVLASTTRWFEGEVVDITTAAGHVLTVTPNHPILTTKGWVAAGLLHEGDHVLSSANIERTLATINPHDHQSPALIEDVAETVGGATRVATACMPTAAEDFHGDGLDGQVCVVRTDRLLLDGRFASFREPQRQEVFSRGPVQTLALDRGGAQALLLEGMDMQAGSHMRGLSVSPVFFGGTRGHHASVSSEAVAWMDAGLKQNALDRTTAAAVAISQRLLGLSCDVPADDLVYGQLALGSQRRGVLRGGRPIAGGFVSPDAFRQQAGAQSLAAGAETARGFIARHAGSIHIDCIRECSRRGFRGHVYNLETSEGWYIANGIITHNCRCAPIPRTRSWRDLGYDVPDDRTSVPRGTDLFDDLDPADQRKILGPAKHAAFQDGFLKLADLRGTATVPGWGRVGFERSLADAIGAEKAREYIAKARVA